MNTTDAQAFVVGGMTAVGVIAVGEAVAEGHAPAARILVGYAGACIGLGIIALPFPDLAAALTGLVLVATFFVNSDALTGAIIKITK